MAATTTNSPAPRWQQLIWLGAGAGLLLTIFVLILFVGATVYRITNIIETPPEIDLAFVFTATAMVMQALLRLLAILVGAAIAFSGLAVSFFASEKAATLGAEAGATGAGKAKVALATYSPGIVGVAVGAIVIIAALFARSTDHYASPNELTIDVPDSSQKQSGSASGATPSRRTNSAHAAASAASAATAKSYAELVKEAASGAK